MKGLLNKQELGNKLENFPLLRQLLYERWFRLAFAAFVSVFVFFALFLPKIWRTSPPGFQPVIKVSGLDRVQAWSLRRTAQKAELAGDYDAANYAWQAALANNQADTNLAHGALQSVLRNPHWQQRESQALSETFWLLKLTKTNIVELELAAKVLERYGHYDLIKTLLGPRTNEFSRPMRAAYLKALFHLGRMSAFDALWIQSGNQLQQDPELQLYRAAYLVGWGAPGTITQARQQLDAAASDPELRSVAYRLQLLVASHQFDAEKYSKVLGELADRREDTVAQHATYWRLLVATGRKDEAVRLSQAYPHPPSSAAEAVELVQALVDLGLREEALQMLSRCIDQFARSPALWVAYGSVLVDTRRWEELRQLTVRIRQQEGVNNQLVAFSYFLEGRAELALGREANADAAFQKATEHEFPYPTLALRVARQLDDSGRPELARQVLMPLEKHFKEKDQKDELSYWMAVFQVAEHLKDVDLLLKAATRAFEIMPKDPVVMNNYAAALLIHRQRPDEVIKLTLQLFSSNPNSLHAVVNHSAALLLNDRPKEAEVLLARVSTNNLNRGQMALYNLDLFETYSGLRQYDRAWAISDRIETNLLYPTQQKWFAQARSQLPPKTKPK